MEWYHYLLIVVGVVLAALITVVLIRTAMFRPQAEAPIEDFPVTCNEEKAVYALQQMIRCKTVSYVDESREDDAEFDKFYALLPQIFPNVYKTCEFQKLTKRSILFRWKGKDSSKCRVMMAHYDVVPVQEDGWSKPAFDGVLEDGVLWGRGTLDTKGTLNGVLQAAEQLICENYVPENDVYFAFAGNEEQDGYGAPSIVNYFKEKGIRPTMVVDEGGAVVEKVFPGVSQPCALVGIAEKGMFNLRFSLKTSGGHASSPAPHTPVGKLSAACVKAENHPFKFSISEPVKKMFNTLGRRSTFIYRMIFANLWLFGGLLNLICKKSGGELNALVRTTVAFTQMQGSQAPNVIPAQAEMVANLRIMCGETTNSAQAYLEKVIGDKDITYSTIYASNPSAVSRAEGEEWERLKKVISQTWQGTIVSPYLMLACSDSRHYGEICDCVYRFSAMALSKEERGMIHGNDERIPVETIKKTVEFYLRLLQNC
ncbi:MAG: M20/M25/M40 family metallo-hydrolase [Clostridia bacterium]|nr:M20/M25/M40 family metallo-hydrolase [Clostridia bacterium]